ncbi:MAG: glycosyltransferase family 2 protein [Beijerinckiaceae bacterium]
MKVAVVTPYYKEPLKQLRQCITSVREQTYPCTHILVADGHPNSGIKITREMQQVILPRSNGDVGNTPRGIGGLLADSWGFDAVAFLDADNWLEPNHIELMIRAHRKTARPLVACKRRFVTLEGAPMEYTEYPESQSMHVDTNCWLITRPAFSFFSAWFMPKELALFGDRVFLQKVVSCGNPVCYTDYRTVAYRTAFAIHYLEAGLTPPPGCKAVFDYSIAREYLSNPANHPELMNRLGFIPAV